MRSGLSLRIPGAHDLSPTQRSQLMKPGLKSSSKLGSPKPSDLKTHHRTSTQYSPYNRIISHKRIKKLSLPSFLHEFSSQKEDMSNVLPINKSSPIYLSDLTADTLSLRTAGTKNKQASQPSLNFEDFLDLVFQKKKKKNEVLLKVGKLQLTRGDLQSLQPKSSISRTTIDACLRCIKHKNKKIFKTTESHDRAMIISTSEAQLIFSEDLKKWPIFDRNPLKYEFTVFPIFLEYWSIVVLDNKQKKVSVYNVSLDSVVIEIVNKVKMFIKKELRQHEKKKIESTGWRDVCFECIHVAGINENDSAAFMIRVAYKISVSHSSSISCEVLDDFRYNLLVMLYKHGLQGDVKLMIN